MPLLPTARRTHSITAQQAGLTLLALAQSMRHPQAAHPDAWHGQHVANSAHVVQLASTQYYNQ
jgi:hypothetical protein